MASDYLANLTANFPDEPPLGSVVLGKSGKVWQSYKFNNDAIGWVTPRPEEHGYNGQGAQKWGFLLIEDGPLKLLWKGDTE